MFEGNDSEFITLSQFPQTFLTNPSKLRIYLCKIPTVHDHMNFDTAYNQTYSMHAAG